VQEAEACEVLAPLATVARCTLADIVIASGHVHADAVLAVVLLAGRGLWVQVRHHRLDFTELAGELSRALTGVLVDPVPARGAVLAHVVRTVVHICRAVLPGEPGQAVTREMGEVILAGPSVLTPVWFDAGTEGNLLFTVSPLKAGRASALIGAHFVDTGSVVLAPVVQAVVDVFLTANSGETVRALTPGRGEVKGLLCAGRWGHSPQVALAAHLQESARLQHLALGLVDTRIAVAGVDDLGASLAIEPGSAPAETELNF
jgi:hypothetical protein